MNDKFEADPYNRWRRLNQPSREVMREISRWFDAEAAATDSIRYTFELNSWLVNHNLQTALNPHIADPVRCIAQYGHTRLITKGWKNLPIQIPDTEREDWRKARFSITNFEELRAYQLSAAGEFLAVAGRDPQAIGDLLVKGVKERVARMLEAANRPLEFYKPFTDWESEWAEDWLDEQGFENELKSFDIPFALREELEYFALGLEHFRMMCFDDEPELGLPNIPLFTALMEVELNQLHATFQAIEPRLREILKYLASIKYHDDPKMNCYLKMGTNDQDRLLDTDEAPDGFWWRHWYKDQHEQAKKAKH